MKIPFCKDNSICLFRLLQCCNWCEIQDGRYCWWLFRELKENYTYTPKWEISYRRQILKSTTEWHHQFSGSHFRNSFLSTNFILYFHVKTTDFGLNSIIVPSSTAFSNVLELYSLRQIFFLALPFNIMKRDENEKYFISRKII